jgi:hypothetical protein
MTRAAYTRLWGFRTQTRIALTSDTRQLWFLVVQREALDGKIVTQNQFGLRLDDGIFEPARVTDSPHQDR